MMSLPWLSSRSWRGGMFMANVSKGYTPALVNTFANLSLSDGKFGEYVDSFYDVTTAGVTLTNGAGHTFTIVSATSVTSSSLTFNITLDSEVTDQVRVKWGAMDGSIDETIYATDFIGSGPLSQGVAGLQTGSDTTLESEWGNEANVGSPTYAADTTLTLNTSVGGSLSGLYVYYQWVFHPTSDHAQYTTPVQRQLLA